MRPRQVTENEKVKGRTRDHQVTIELPLEELLVVDPGTLRRELKDSRVLNAGVRTEESRGVAAGRSGDDGWRAGALGARLPEHGTGRGVGGFGPGEQPSSVSNTTQ